MTLLSEAPPLVTDGPALQAPALPRVNLLPPEIGERARLRRLQAVLAGGVVVAAGAVGLLQLSASAGVAEATDQVAGAQARGSALQAQTRELADVDVVYAEAARAQARLSTALGQEVRFSQFLDGLTTSVPDHVWLRNVTFTQGAAAGADAAATTGIGTVAFTGVGFRHDDVAAWLESLESQPGFADAYVSDATAGLIGTRRTVSFTSTVTLTADALSGRYVEEGS